ncbi:MAG: DUF1634 domain-containing protein [Acidobacteria bacterium]|nr:DUF1634 domain-containing protein [Acidobacteriota bacterium]
MAKNSSEAAHCELQAAEPPVTNVTPGAKASADASKEPFWTEKRIELVVGRLLQIGVLLAALVVIAGGVPYLVRGGEPESHYHIFTGEREDLRSVAGVLHDLSALRTRAIIQLGLLLLILTPIARVAFSAIAFGLQKDYMYVVITLIVFSILMYSLMGHYVT